MWDHITRTLSGLFAEAVIALLNPFAPYGAHVQSDVPYAPGAPHRADIYRPNGGMRGRSWCTSAGVGGARP